jgi:hypothetical protein
MSKLYSHAGTSTQNGETKVRFCNDSLRVKVLEKNSHKNVDIIELTEPMTKEAAVAFLLSIDFDNGNKEVRAALEAAADKRGVEIPKSKPAAKGVMKPKAQVQAQATAVADAEPALM